MNNNDEKIKKALENEEVPKELEPENIKKMLDEKAPSQKRKKISVAGRITAVAAACAVIVGSTAVYKSVNPKKTNCPDKLVETSKDENSEISTSENESSSESEPETEIKDTGSYMTGAEDYEQIYTMIKEVTKKQNERGLFTNGAKSADIAETADGAVAENAVDGAAVQSAENYDGEAADDFEYDSDESSIGMAEAPEESIEEPVYADEESSEIIEEPVEEPIEEPEIIDEEESSESSEEQEEETEEATDEEPEHSETYNQEKDVLEADIVKTDGKNIYYVNNDYDDDYNNIAEINYASVDNGMFTGSGTINVSESVNGYFGGDYQTDTYIQDMYLYNDMLVVLGTVNGYSESGSWEYDDYWYDYKNSCFVTFYTTGETPQLIDTYYQDGSYNDVRITPDGYMYLITNYNSYDYTYIENSEQIERYIPSCGLSAEVECLPAGDILLPDNAFEESYNLSYTVVGSLDLTQSGTFSAVDSKALAGYTGEIYCSGSNLYTTYGWDDTEITRISIGSGMINPEACGTVEGRVNDQFSMSEYDGYFRIAVTNDEYEEVYHSYYDEYYDEDDPSVWERVKDKLTGEESGYYSYDRIKRDNRLYVLDMDMNVVGSVSDFGIDEEIKSVKFSGNMAYVVTYEQTDPLFAIDLSDPTNPTILDEFKILGYSTYMQEWGDGLLLGFGANADEDGIENGLKLTMFDNSDPYNLDALATYVIDSNNEYEYIYSEAKWEHKALLIAPEKNIIGVPVIIENYGYYDTYEDEVLEETQFNSTSKYMFFSYDNGEFTLKGEISKTDNSWDNNFSRAVYIGNYVYAISGDSFVSADIETITECDRVDF